jgi:ketosteroid isomerase-like protein
MTEAYTTEGLVLPPNGETVTGKQNIQAFWQLVLDSFGIQAAELETVELSQEGDTAFEVGKFLIKDAASNQLDQGKYVVIWKQENG